MGDAKLFVGFRFVLNLLLLVFLSLGIMVYYKTLQNEEEKRKRWSKQSLQPYYTRNYTPTDPRLDKVPVSPNTFSTQTECNANCDSRFQDCLSQLSGDPRGGDICRQEVGECYLKCSRGDYGLVPQQQVPLEGYY